MATDGLAGGTQVATREPSVSLDPDVARPVDHDFRDVGIIERGFEAGQERFQEVQPVAGHSWPACLAFQ